MDAAEPMTAKQRGQIIALGGRPGQHMNKLEASKFILYLYDRLKCANCGCSYVPGKLRCFSCGAYVPKLTEVNPPEAIYTPKGLWESLFG